MHDPILLESKNVSIQGFGPQMLRSILGNHPNYQLVYVVHSYAAANPPKNNLFFNIVFIYARVLALVVK